MGWTFTHRDKGITDREFFEAEFPTALRERGRIVACATKNNVFYAAVENGPDAEYHPGQTWALVVLIQRQRSYYNFGYKDLSEDSGLGGSGYECPARVLDALSPTDNEWAIQWREGCRKVLAEKAAAVKVKRGDRVKFARPMKFSNGAEYDTFEFEERTTFRVIDGPRVKITKWRDREFAVLAA